MHPQFPEMSASQRNLYLMLSWPEIDAENLELTLIEKLFTEILFRDAF